MHYAVVMHITVEVASISIFLLSGKAIADLSVNNGYPMATACDTKKLLIDITSRGVMILNLDVFMHFGITIQRYIIIL